ncbi:hypothetical protein LTS15_006664 [Exophiala xenobiotica]|nr:hypothetical protein LTS15_006664 [Exophiala xenobiotica]
MSLGPKMTVSGGICESLPIGPPGSVTDISGTSLSDEFLLMLQKRLLQPDVSGRRFLPTAMLYNDSGMEIWQRITHLPTYYQTTDEIILLEHHGKDLAGYVQAGSVILDIGSGYVDATLKSVTVAHSLYREARKIMPLLDALEALQRPVEYFALDLSQPALEQAVTELTRRYRFVRPHGLWGTFDDAFRWAQETRQLDVPIWYVSLGSFFGNDQFDAAVNKLSQWRSLMRRQDRMLLGMDAQDDSAVVWGSYHDPSGVFVQFMRNGLMTSNQVLGHQWYRAEDWEVVGVMEKGPPLKHKFTFRARHNVICEPLKINISAGDEIDCYDVYKYGPDILRQQFLAASLTEVASFKAPHAPFYEYLLMMDDLGKLENAKQ